ncbi:16S rRNA (guanine(966)-N(2))-methyltransferase RsmD [Litchfieldella rifensis]|uniref:Ribosomal RNA small subunit methyltransferase D n=1 Tax=Litchfieldella rifensis TaxID=762643 RepID=A0ABV7LQ94_9GAMM
MKRRPPSRPPSRRKASPASRHGGGGKLRIIGGEYRRRLLPILDSPGLRPTPDRIRETLFNWLTAVTPGARVLDLYAGTGALGLEALSRGARQAVFVERAPAVAAVLEANLATLEAAGRVEIADTLAFLDRAATPFALVFLDPPFRQGLAEPSCAALEAHGWLTEDAFIYLETERELMPRVPVTWQLQREVRAGDGTGRLYRRTSSS